MTPNALDRLIAIFSKLPGIGKKSAGRIAYYILDSGSAFAENFASELSNLHKVICRCSICGCFTEIDSHQQKDVQAVCSVCSDTERDHSVICVIESAQDMRIIEAGMQSKSGGEFNGVYHVLGGLIAPLDGVGPENLSIGRLIERIHSAAGGRQPIKEIILALNPTVEGDTTALYLQKQLKEFDIEVTRLASGMPVGGNIEYIDKLTLSRSFRGRTRV